MPESLMKKINYGTELLDIFVLGNLRQQLIDMLLLVVMVIKSTVHQTLHVIPFPLYKIDPFAKPTLL